MIDDSELEAKSVGISAPSANPKAANVIRTFVLWLLAGLFLGGIAALVIVRWKYGDALPELTPADYFAAKEKWKASAPPDYDIEVEVQGTQAATYRVQVRGGEAVAAWRNDIPLTQQRTFGTWSVPGMFGTMSRDVEVLDRHLKGKAEPNAPRLTLRAQFDPQYGYPAGYRRIQWRSPVQVMWQVVKFEVVP